MFFYIQLLGACDTQPLENRRLGLSAYDFRSMQSAMAQNPGHRKAFIDYVTASSTTSIDDICAWTGVNCGDDSDIDRQVNAVMVVGTGRYNWKVNTAWIPHTVESLYLTKVMLERPTKCRALPRMTKFAYFSRCTMNIIGKSDDVFDLRDLPKEMEELFIRSVWVRGTVCIQEVPQNFRLLLIQSPQLKKVVLGDLDAPMKAFCRLHFESSAREIDIIASSDAPLRQRLGEINDGCSYWALGMSVERDDIYRNTSRKLKYDWES